MNEENQNFKSNVIVFLGPPASGKGTAANYLEKKHNIKSISPGFIFKKIRNDNSELAELVKESVKDGGLCPSWLTNKLVQQETNNLLMQGYHTISLDGFPRTLEQLEFLNNNYNVLLFVHSNTNWNIMKKLVTQRRNCKVCNSVFSTNNSYFENECCKLEDNWEKRWDDTPEMFAKRYKVYKQETFPIIEKIKKLENYIKVDLIKNIYAYREIEKALSLR